MSTISSPPVRSACTVPMSASSRPQWRWPAPRSPSYASTTSSPGSSTLLPARHSSVRCEATMATEYDAADVAAAMRRVAAALKSHQAELTELDQNVGDGDLGVTAVKLAEALET